MSAIRLRRALQSDAAAIGALHVESWRETYAGILPGDMLAELSVDARAAMWNDVIGTPGAVEGNVVVIAEDEGRMIGFGSCGRQRDEALSAAGFDGEIGAIYVLRSNQHRGVGRSIMAELARALSDLGHCSASLWVLRENDPARRFYEALGGEVVGEKSDEWLGTPLVEVAYGWPELSRLAALCGLGQGVPER